MTEVDHGQALIDTETLKDLLRAFTRQSAPLPIRMAKREPLQISRVSSLSLSRDIQGQVSLSVSGPGDRLHVFQRRDDLIWDYTGVTLSKAAQAPASEAPSHGTSEETPDRGNGRRSRKSQGPSA